MRPSSLLVNVLGELMCNSNVDRPPRRDVDGQRVFFVDPRLQLNRQFRAICVRKLVVEREPLVDVHNRASAMVSKM